MPVPTKIAMTPPLARKVTATTGLASPDGNGATANSLRERSTQPDARNICHERANRSHRQFPFVARKTVLRDPTARQPACAAKTRYFMPGVATGNPRCRATSAIRLS